MLLLGCAQPQEPTSAHAAPVPSAVPARSEPPAAVQAHNRPRFPILSEAAREAHVQAQSRLLGSAPFLSSDAGTAAKPARASAVGNLDAFSLGRPVALEGAGDSALRRFHASLRALATGADDADKVRVLFYGSSQTAADYVTTYLREYLQHRFGDGGHGFVALAAPWRTYRHLDVTLKTTKRWHTDHAQRSDRREDGCYGLLGASTSAKRRHDRTTVRPDARAAASRFELQYLMQPKGGHFAVDVDRKPTVTIATAAERMSPGYHELALEQGVHELRIRPRGDGEVRLFGVVMENSSLGVVVDTLGINGARAANHLVWDEALWADAVRRRDPRLYVLAYGGNEAGDTDEDIAQYEHDLRAVLSRFSRVAPDASCLLVGPGDFPEKGEDGAYRPRERLSQIIAIQRVVASERGCAFWDTQAFMGGPMSMNTWVAAEPAMARDDHLHLTKRGYTRMGMALVDAIMYGYDAVE